MNSSKCVAALAALAHEHRLRAFRLLVRNGPGGVSAGDIAEHLALAPSSLSFHLAHLERCGLIHSRREQRRIIYAADLDAMGRLLSFLTEDCCAGHPEICSTLMPAVSKVAPRPRGSKRAPR